MKLIPTFFVLGFLSLFAAAVAAQQPASAEGYPSRPVKVIVPYAAGSAADIIGRLIAQKMSEITGGQFYVENLPGAGGTIGAGTASRATADGYTLLLMNQDFVVEPAVRSRIPYDPFKSFTPVSLVAAAAEVISINPSVPATNMKELIALVRANPGKYRYATPGYGTSPHVACERLFKLTHGRDLVHVPFKGGGPAVLATIADQTQILHITLPLVATHIKEGKLRGLAVADKRRSAMLPDVPTLEELGIPRHEVRYWTGVLTPAGTPEDVVDLLNSLIVRAVRLPDMKERLATLGFGAVAGTREEFAAYLKAEATEWARVVREARIKVE